MRSTVRFISKGKALIGLTFLMFLSVAFSYTNLQHYYANSERRTPFKSDKAGYSVFLPATFHYQWNAANFPDSVEYNVQGGFMLDRESGIVRTKYPCGVAFMQLPFYAVADLWETVFNPNQNTGYGRVHVLAWHLSGTLYVFLGLMLLYQLLRRYLTPLRALLTTLFTLFGTPLFYYMFFDTTMSHSYSFFLFVALLYSVHELSFKPSWRWTILTGLTIGLIVAVRHFNIIAVFPLALLLLASKEWRKWLRDTRYLSLLSMVGLMLLLLIPQLIYNQHAYGGLLVDTYSEEGFNWSKPQILYQMFGARNGLALYTPALFLGLLLLIYRAARPSRGATEFSWYTQSTAVLIIAFAYMTSCWHAPEFGCSFSMRPYTEFTALIVFALVPAIRGATKRQFQIAAIALSLLSIYTGYMSYFWKGCAFFSREDYGGYFQVLLEGF